MNLQQIQARRDQLIRELKRDGLKRDRLQEINAELDDLQAREDALQAG